MTFEARITIHQRGLLRPDYKDVERRMLQARYHRVLDLGGHRLHESHGMYTKTTLLAASTVRAERATIEQHLKSLGFAFSIELIQVAHMETFNLEPADDYSSLGYLYGMLNDK